jgi:hypothetical protein
MRGLVISGAMTALLGAWAIARAQGGGAKTWDFQSGALNAPPAGFSFGRTGQGREGKWVVVQDPTAPWGDHVLAQVDPDETEDNVNLYHVVKGRRGQIKGWSGKVAPNAWHALAIEARGDRLQVLWEGKPIIDAKDDTFGDAGKVGVWTKADSVTYFAALTATPLP